MKQETTLTVKNMTCGGCEKSVERALLSVRGVVSARAFRDKQQVTVEYHPEDATEDQLRQAIVKAGFHPA